MKAQKDRTKKLALLLLLVCISTGGYHAATRRDRASAEMHLMQGTLDSTSGDGYQVAINDVTPQKMRSHRTSKIAISTETVSTPDSYKTAKIDAGLDITNVYVLPVVRLHVAVSGGFVIGAYASYVKNLTGVTSEAYGGGVTGEYYFGGRPFQGWLVDASVGAYRVTGRNAFRSSTASPIAVSSTIGWTGSFMDVVAVQLALGAQYALNGTNNIGDVRFNGLLPLAKVGLGFSF